MELSRFVGQYPKRSVEEIKASIEAFKRSILALELEPTKLLFITPQGMPDLNISVNASSVITSFMVGKERMKDVIDAIGYSRVLETIEYSLIRAYNECKERKLLAVKTTDSIIEKLKKKDQTMSKKDKTKEPYPLKMDKKTKMVKDHVYQIVDSVKDEPIHGRQVVFNIKSTNKALKEVNFMLQYQDQSGKWVDKDKVTGTLNPSDKKTVVAMKVPSTFRILAMVGGDGVSVKLKKVETIPIQSQ